MSATPLVLSLKKRLQAAVAANKTEVSPTRGAGRHSQPQQVLITVTTLAGNDQRAAAAQEGCGRD